LLRRSDACPSRTLASLPRHTCVICSMSFCNCLRSTVKSKRASLFSSFVDYSETSHPDLIDILA
jgi:hypothetical protein